MGKFLKAAEAMRTSIVTVEEACLLPKPLLACAKKERDALLFCGKANRWHID
jgi:hypothetical protein